MDIIKIKKVVYELLRRDFDVEDTELGLVIFSNKEDYLAMLDHAVVYSRGEEFKFCGWDINKEGTGQVLKYWRQCFIIDSIPVSNIVMLFIQKVANNEIQLDSDVWKQCKTFTKEYLKQIK